MWCLRTVAHEGTGEVALDGSAWEFKRDGTFRYDAELLIGGTWTLEGDRLALSKVGNYEVVSLAAERMELIGALGAKHAFHRECGAEVDAAKDVAALRSAVANGDWLMAKAFLDKGVDVNAPDLLDMSRRTALFTAAQMDQRDIAKELLARGARVATATSLEKTPFDAARTNPAIMALLAQHLPQPASLDAPAIVALPPQGTCPPDHLALSEVCVHHYALPRPALRSEIEAFTGGSASPRLASYRPEAELVMPAEAEAQAKPEEPEAGAVDYVADPSLLDPGALANPDGQRAGGRARSGGTRSGGTRSVRSDQSDEYAESAKQLQAILQMGEAMQTPEGRKSFMKTWCTEGKRAVENARAGNNGEFAEKLGITKEEHRRRLEEKYRKECPGGG